MNIEAAHSSYMSGIFYQTIRCHVPEHSSLKL